VGEIGPPPGAARFSFGEKMSRQISQRKTLIDISVLLEPGMVVWPGDPEYRRFSVSSVESGDICSVTRFSMGSHTGTHIDAPAHFIRNGVTADEVPLDILIGEALVVEIDKDNLRGAISADDLISVDLKGVSKLLLKTANSKLLGKSRFINSFIYLTGDAARYLVDHGIKLVGIDYLSIDKPDSDDAHRILLENGTAILETINLSDVKPGLYELICLPLKVFGSDGAPARAVLRVL
jgi:arylformamidase